MTNLYTVGRDQSGQSAMVKHISAATATLDEQVLSLVKAWIAVHGYSITLDEIAGELGVSFNKAYRAVGRLVKNGVLERKGNFQQSRSLYPVLSRTKVETEE